MSDTRFAYISILKPRKQTMYNISSYSNKYLAPFPIPGNTVLSTPHLLWGSPNVFTVEPRHLRFRPSSRRICDCYAWYLYNRDSILRIGFDCAKDLWHFLVVPTRTAAISAIRVRLDLSRHYKLKHYLHTAAIFPQRNIVPRYEWSLLFNSIQAESMKRKWAICHDIAAGK